MHSSRILRFAAEKAHAQGFLLPPRTSMDILASAGNAVLNLFSSEDQRKRFAALVNSGVIAPEVLGQANLSYFRILALHDELDSPTLKEFNVAEFLDGVKPALEQLHDVQANLQNNLNEIASSSSEEDEENDDNDVLDVTDKNIIPSLMLRNPGTDKTWRRLLKKKHSWKEQAEKDPESYEARLIAMLSPQHFERFELASKLSFGFAPRFLDLNVEVHNIALLSARGMIIQPNDETMNDDEITSDEAKQKIVDAEESVNKLPAVAAQIEVLYDVEETLLVPADTGSEESNQGSEKENKSDDSDQVETKTITRTSVVVGVFEGFLSGGDEEGLWRVCDIRYPLEFPFLTPQP